jgi:Gas vesicle synthesis protein GvpL/GvpF
MVHLYALVDHPARLPDLPGVAGSRLAAAQAEAGIDAVYGDGVDPADASEEAILAHARVVEELAAVNDAVLPARYPGRYDDDEALVGAITSRAAELREALDRVRGCVELGVRIVRHESGDDDPPASGRDYMRRRLADVRGAERLAADLDTAVGGLVREGTRAVTASGGLVLSAAYLLPRDAAGAFRAAVETLARDHPDLAYVCVGPWPPYSFALVDGRSA